MTGHGTRYSRRAGNQMRNMPATNEATPATGTIHASEGRTYESENDPAINQLAHGAAQGNHPHAGTGSEYPLHVYAAHQKYQAREDDQQASGEVVRRERQCECDEQRVGEHTERDSCSEHVLDEEINPALILRRFARGVGSKTWRSQQAKKSRHGSSEANLAVGRRAQRAHHRWKHNEWHRFAQEIEHQQGRRIIDHTRQPHRLRDLALIHSCPARRISTIHRKS